MPWPSPKNAGGASAESGQRPLVALICDDEELILDLLEHHLSNQGFEIIRASDGQVALDEMERRIPDVVVTDVMMPYVQGDELLRKIRETPLWRHIPVLMLTMRSEEEDVVSAFEGGASDYLSKPFTCAELTARVNRLVRPAEHPLGELVEEPGPAPEINLRPALA